VDKIRQAGATMPAVAIRQIEGLTRVLEYTTGGDQRSVLRRQVEMVAAEAARMPEDSDRRAVDARVTRFMDTLRGLEDGRAANLEPEQGAVSP
jgi:uncharacterized membrane protein